MAMFILPQSMQAPDSLQSEPGAPGPLPADGNPHFLQLLHLGKLHHIMKI